VLDATLVTARQLHRALFLINQGYKDDLVNNVSDFTVAAEEAGLPDLLVAVRDTPVEDVRSEELLELVVYTLERSNEARALILNIESGQVSALQNFLHWNITRLCFENVL
jgi:hypothetical protein